MTTQEETEALAAADRVLVILERGNDPPNHEDVERVAKYLLSSSAAARGMREALEKAAEQFEFYGREHRQKATNSRFNGIEVLAVSSDEKAATNEKCAAMCREALSPNRPLAEEEK